MTTPGISTDRRIYNLHHESEEILAATAAKTSRSAEPFDVIMAKINEDQAAGFLDRVFNGYNHSSIADAAVPMMAIENVSILASKLLEDMPRSAAQERSTRYQLFTRDSVFKPLTGSAAGSAYTTEELELYEQAVSACFDAYEQLTEPMMSWAEAQIPQDTPNRAGAVRGKAFDSLRYLLPAGTKTQLAARMPANDWCVLIARLYCSRNPEFIAIADELLAELKKVVPTLIKRAEFNPWTARTDDTLRAFANLMGGLEDRRVLGGAPYPLEASEWSVTFDQAGILPLENNVLATLLYRHSGLSFQMCRSWIRTHSAEAWEWYRKIFEDRKSRHDRVPKELESIHYTFDIVMDYGAYRDLHRQRRCTILPQALTTNLGFSVPEGPPEVDFAPPLAQAGEFARKLEERGSGLAPYAIPLGYNHRSVHIYDLAQLYYVGELRTEPGCHISYRRVVEDMVRQAKHYHPRLLEFIRVTPSTRAGIHS